ncbi:MAG: hypothetical protein ACE5F6_19605, partial [Anaerolineae bacterium]
MLSLLFSPLQSILPSSHRRPRPSRHDPLCHPPARTARITVMLRTPAYGSRLEKLSVVALGETTADGQENAEVEMKFASGNYTGSSAFARSLKHYPASSTRWVTMCRNRFRLLTAVSIAGLLLALAL